MLLHLAPLRVLLASIDQSVCPSHREKRDEHTALTPCLFDRSSRSFAFCFPPPSPPPALPVLQCAERLHPYLTSQTDEHGRIKLDLLRPLDPVDFPLSSTKINFCSHSTISSTLPPCSLSLPPVPRPFAFPPMKKEDSRRSRARREVVGILRNQRILSRPKKINVQGRDAKGTSSVCAT